VKLRSIYIKRRPKSSAADSVSWITAHFVNFYTPPVFRSLRSAVPSVFWKRLIVRKDDWGTRCRRNFDDAMWAWYSWSGTADLFHSTCIL